LQQIVPTPLPGRDVTTNEATGRPPLGIPAKHSHDVQLPGSSWEGNHPPVARIKLLLLPRSRGWQGDASIGGAERRPAALQQVRPQDHVKIHPGFKAWAVDGAFGEF